MRPTGNDPRMVVSITAAVAGIHCTIVRLPDFIAWQREPSGINSGTVGRWEVGAGAGGPVGRIDEAAHLLSDLCPAKLLAHMDALKSLANVSGITLAYCGALHHARFPQSRGWARDHHRPSHRLFEGLSGIRGRTTSCSLNGSVGIFEVLGATFPGTRSRIAPVCG